MTLTLLGEEVYFEADSGNNSDTKFKNEFLSQSVAVPMQT
jgi:hypothetical protein